MSLIGKRPDHICTGRTCVFCKTNGGGARAVKVTGARSFMDTQALEHVKELEQKSMLTRSESRKSTGKGEEIERLALMDSLTDLYNKRTLTRELADELRRSKRYKRPLSVCIISIDKLMDIQTQFGTPTFESVVKSIGELLLDCVREVDIPARYASDEFAVIFPEINSRTAMTVAERVRDRIVHHKVQHNFHKLNVTASVGLASFPTAAKDPEDLLNKASWALTQCKEQGGDRVVAYKAEKE